MLAHTARISSTFRQGDGVVLVEGTYQGTLGVFVRFREDAGWADIEERNGAIRCHPVAWLGYASEQGACSGIHAATTREAGTE